MGDTLTDHGDAHCVRGRGRHERKGGAIVKAGPARTCSMRITFLASWVRAFLPRTPRAARSGRRAAGGWQQGASDGGMRVRE